MDLSSDRTTEIRNPMLDGVAPDGITLGSHREGTVTKETGNFVFMTTTSIDWSNNTVKIRRQVLDKTLDA